MRQVAYAIVLALLLPIGAFAHSPLKATFPADNSEMKTQPDKLTLEFGKPARLTKIVLTHALGEANHADRLELPSRSFQKLFELTPQFRGKGDYKVEWRALSDDGHPLNGAFSFSVSE
ncbi:copper resistance protein CopC [Pseudahrensia aquimaris]|uniref:Copper resistance protein CopC n=1 Tax=Pseudahrensia aquimaris TaxID=744461 RepID=A0ABW3FHY5_9HYPH